MLQRRLSSEAEIQLLGEQETRRHLDRYLTQTMRPGFLGQLSLRLQDPFTDKNSFRLNPFWGSLTLLFALALSVFLYFSFVRR